MLVRKPLPSAGRTGVADAKWQSVCSLDVLIRSSINPLHSLTVYTLGPPLNPVRDHLRSEILCRDQLGASAVSATGGLCKRSERSFVCNVTIWF